MASRTYACPACNTRSAEPAILCGTCGTPLKPLDPPGEAAGLREPGTVGASASDALPPVQFEAGDHERPEHLARVSLGTEPATAEFLLNELGRAKVSRELPGEVAAPYARILFKLDGEDQIEGRTLVYPEDYLPTGQYLTILSPLGVALLGPATGDRMPFRDRQGTCRAVTVSAIAYRPEARGFFETHSAL